LPRNQLAVLAQAIEMKANRGFDFWLNFLAGCPHRDIAGMVGNIGREVCYWLFRLPPHIASIYRSSASVRLLPHINGRGIVAFRAVRVRLN
jgi:hypothetical protein